LKKDLVDQGLLSLSQRDLEDHLFRIMETKGYGDIYRERFSMTLKCAASFGVRAALVCLTSIVAGSTTNEFR